MVILVLDRVPTGLRGELSRWMVELKAGVFIGTLSAEVRERLWRLAVEKSKGGALFLAFPARREQRYELRTHGQSTREVVDFDGLQLVRTVRGDRDDSS